MAKNKSFSMVILDDNNTKRKSFSSDSIIVPTLLLTTVSAATVLMLTASTMSIAATAIVAMLLLSVNPWHIIYFRPVPKPGRPTGFGKDPIGWINRKMRGIVDKISEVFKRAGKWMNDLLKRIKKPFEDLYKKMKDKISKFKEKVKRWGEKIKTKFKDTISEYKKKFGLDKIFNMPEQRGRWGKTFKEDLIKQTNKTFGRVPELPKFKKILNNLGIPEAINFMKKIYNNISKSISKTALKTKNIFGKYFPIEKYLPSSKQYKRRLIEGAESTLKYKPAASFIGLTKGANILSKAKAFAFNPWVQLALITADVTYGSYKEYKKGERPLGEIILVQTVRVGWDILAIAAGTAVGSLLGPIGTVGGFAAGSVLASTGDKFVVDKMYQLLDKKKTSKVGSATWWTIGKIVPGIGFLLDSEKMYNGIKEDVSEIKGLLGINVDLKTTKNIKGDYTSINGSIVLKGESVEDTETDWTEYGKQITSRYDNVIKTENPMYLSINTIAEPTIPIGLGISGANINNGISVSLSSNGATAPLGVTGSEEVVEPFTISRPSEEFVSYMKRKNDVQPTHGTWLKSVVIPKYEKIYNKNKEKIRQIEARIAEEKAKAAAEKKALTSKNNMDFASKTNDYKTIEKVANKLDKLKSVTEMNNRELFDAIARGDISLNELTA